MKKSLIVLALMASFGAMAQDSTSTSGSQSGSNSTSNVNAVGNENSATANSGSQSGADATSSSGAAGNIVVIDQSGPSSQTVNVNETSSYHGKTEHVQSGTTTQNIIHSGTTSQRIKNVPGIAMSGPASGPCTGASGGLGLAGPGWGLGLNGAKVEPTCVVRENVRVIGMAMQSLDGNLFANEKAELMQLMMDAVRGLGAMNSAIIGDNLKK